MKGRNFSTIAFLLVAGLAFLLTACSGPAIYHMQSGERTAGAEGELSVINDSNGNQVVDLTVAHLPRPSQLSEQMAIYTVWIQPAESGQYYNVGRLRLSDDRTGNLVFTTPFSAYEMMVTAESKPTEMSPSDQVVLRYTMGGSPTR